MAPVSMALHVSYMRSFCKKEWRTSRQMILSAVRHGVAEEFIQFCAGLRVNKRCALHLTAFTRQWHQNNGRVGYLIFPRRVIMYGWVCVAWRCHKLPSPVVRAPLLLCRQTAASSARRSQQGIPVVYCRPRGIAVPQIVAWHCSASYCGVGGQLVACPVSGQPNVCLDVTAIAVLHTTPLPLFLGHPSVQDPVDRVDTVAMAVVQQHREMLKACTDMCNAPISRRTIRAPLDIAQEASRQQLFWKLFGIHESRTGQN